MESERCALSWDERCCGIQFLKVRLCWLLLLWYWSFFNLNVRQVNSNQLKYLFNKKNRGNKPEGSAEFLIVHSGLVLALAPFLCDKLWLVEFELALLANPGDTISCILVCQQLQKELPQLDLTVVAWWQMINNTQCKMLETVIKYIHIK